MRSLTGGPTDPVWPRGPSNPLKPYKRPETKNINQYTLIDIIKIIRINIDASV